MPFASLGLPDALVRAVEERGYRAPTPVQSAAIPAILANADVWACAHTGSGKTAAFALPLLQKCLDGGPAGPNQTQALILAPTRELGIQIGESFRRYARFAPSAVRIVTAFGGVSINPQMMALRGGANILVATPGRLLDLVDHNALRLGGLQTLVLDEADRLLDLGFADELARIFELLPARRQNLLFSATFPPDVHAMAEYLLRDPVRIEASSASSAAPIILQRAIQVDSTRRTQLLRHLIQAHGWTRTLVFVATRYATEHVALKLRRAGIDAAALHGELGPWARSQALTNFKAQRLPVLVATDLAARGIDIELLPVVVNYDLPRSTHDYLHRIGRTGRAGAQGVAVSFISPATEAHFHLIEKRHQFELARETIEGFEVTEMAPSATISSHDAGNPITAIPGNTGGIKGKRKSKKDRLREALGKGSASD